MDQFNDKENNLIKIVTCSDDKTVIFWSIHTEELISNKVRELFNLTPKGIITTLDLKRPIYKQTAAYGHFGRTDIDLPWEHLDKVEELKALLK